VSSLIINEKLQIYGDMIHFWNKNYTELSPIWKRIIFRALHLIGKRCYNNHTKIKSWIICWNGMNIVYYINIPHYPFCYKQKELLKKSKITGTHFTQLTT
jgi:hypothetical protein